MVLIPLLMNDEGYRKEFYPLSGGSGETQIISNEKWPNFWKGW